MPFAVTLLMSACIETKGIGSGEMLTLTSLKAGAVAAFDTVKVKMYGNVFEATRVFAAMVIDCVAGKVIGLFVMT